MNLPDINPTVAVEPTEIPFDGVFRFTNWTETDFTAKWNNVEYTFPALKTSPMIIPGETPEGVQSIRKKFAKELAEREFYRTEKFKSLNDIPAGQTPATYTDGELASFIQKCLEPLEIAHAKVAAQPRADVHLSVDPKNGQPVSSIIDDGASLVGNGAVIA